MKVGDKIEFYCFSVLEKGTVVEINKDKTLQIACGGVIYPGVKTFKHYLNEKKKYHLGIFLKIKYIYYCGGKERGSYRRD